VVDYSELKKLAESLNRAIEQAEHKPGQWAGTAQSVGGICCAGEPFQIGKPWAKEEPWAHFSYKRDSWLAVAAVNALPQLMALIAENERVKARLCVCRDCGGQGEAYSGHSSYQGYNQPPEPDMDVCGTCGGDGVLGPLEDFESLAAERDQLKAEIAGLKTGYEAYEQVNAGLKAEAGALRKDSESYHLLSFCHGQGTLELVRSHHELCAEIRRLKIIAGEPVPPTPEEFIGPSPEGPTARIRRKLAAMGKGEQS
jgi:hypothetical protein